MFFPEICEIFKNNDFGKHLRTTASEIITLTLTGRIGSVKQVMIFSLISAIVHNMIRPYLARKFINLRKLNQSEPFTLV